jgi:predicted ester cyclase
MNRNELAAAYRGYIACLNRQDWQRLGNFVGDAVTYNGEQVGLQGYRAMLERDFRQIPDLVFNIELLVTDPPYVSSRLHFHVTPAGEFLGLAVNGRKIFFAENVFYEFA